MIKKKVSAKEVLTKLVEIAVDKKLKSLNEVDNSSNSGKVIGKTKSGKPIYAKSYKHINAGHFDLKDTKETLKNKLDKFIKTLPDGKHGVEISSTTAGVKRYLVDKLDGTLTIESIPKNIFDRATGVKSSTMYAGV